MRKYDVFGRKLNQSRPLYLLIAILLVVLAAYFLILWNKNTRLADLESEAELLEAQIEAVMDEDETQTYQEITELWPYLPDNYNQAQIVSELELVRNLSGLSLARTYDIIYDQDSELPFSDNLPDSLKAVKIDISMQIDDPSMIMDYLDNLNEIERLYYVDSVAVQYMIDDSALVNLTIYTFYINQE